MTYQSDISAKSFLSYDVRFCIMDSNDKWVDFSGVLRKTGTITNKLESNVGSLVTTIQNIELDNSSGMFNLPLTNLLTTDRSTAVFPLSKNKKRTILKGRKCKISVRMRIPNNTITNVNSNAVDAVEEYTLGVFFIDDITPDESKKSMKLKLISIDGVLQGKDADGIKDGYDWYRDRSISFLIEQILISEHDVSAPGNYIEKNPFLSTIDGSNYVSLLGRPPMWDGTNWRRDGLYCRALCVANLGSLGNLLYLGCDNELWSYSPLTGIYTKIGEATSDYNIRKIFNANYIFDTIVFSGSGTNDMAIRGTYTGSETPPMTLKIKVVAESAISSAIADAENSGLDDCTSGGTYNPTTIPSAGTTVFYIEIDGDTGSPNTFKWKKGLGDWTTNVPMTGSAQTLEDGVTITWGSLTGHVVGDNWEITVNVDRVSYTYDDVNYGYFYIDDSSTWDEVGSGNGVEVQFATAVGHTLDDEWQIDIENKIVICAWKDEVWGAKATAQTAIGWAFKIYTYDGSSLTEVTTGSNYITSLCYFLRPASKYTYTDTEEWIVGYPGSTQRGENMYIPFSQHIKAIDNEESSNDSYESKSAVEDSDGNLLGATDGNLDDNFNENNLYYRHAPRGWCSFYSKNVKSGGVVTGNGTAITYYVGQEPCLEISPYTVDGSRYLYYCNFKQKDSINIIVHSDAFNSENWFNLNVYSLEGDDNTNSVSFGTQFYQSVPTCMAVNGSSNLLYIVLQEVDDGTSSNGDCKGVIVDLTNIDVDGAWGTPPWDSNLNFTSYEIDDGIGNAIPDDDNTSGIVPLTSGTYTGDGDCTYEVTIYNAGYDFAWFIWRKDGGSWSSQIAVTGSAQTIENGISINFQVLIGHVIGDSWTIKVSADGSKNAYWTIINMKFFDDNDGTSHTSDKVVYVMFNRATGEYLLCHNSLQNFRSSNAVYTTANILRRSSMPFSALAIDSVDHCIYAFESGANQLIKITKAGVATILNDYPVISGEVGLLSGLAVNNSHTATYPDLYGVTSMNTHLEANYSIPSGRYTMFRLYQGVSDIIELADFSDMKKWDVLKKLAQIRDGVVFFDSNGYFKFITRVYESGTADFVIGKGNDVDIRPIKDIEMDYGNDEIYNHIKASVYDVVFTPPSNDALTLIERTEKNYKDTDGQTIPFVEYNIEQKDTAKKMIYAYCVKDGSTTDGNSRWKYSITQYDVEGILRSDLLTTDPTPTVIPLQSVYGGDDYDNGIHAGDFAIVTDSDTGEYLIRGVVSVDSSTDEVTIDSAFGIDLYANSIVTFSKLYKVDSSYDNSNWSDSGVTYVTTGASVGGTTVSVASIRGLSVGCVVKFGEQASAYEYRISSIDGLTLTLERMDGTATSVVQVVISANDVVYAYYSPKSTNIYQIGGSGVYVKWYEGTGTEDEDYCKTFLAGDQLVIDCPGTTLEDTGSTQIAVDGVSINTFGKSEMSIDNRFLLRSIAKNKVNFLLVKWANPKFGPDFTIPLCPYIDILNANNEFTQIDIKDPDLFPNSYNNVESFNIRSIKHDLSVGVTTFNLKAIEPY